MTQNANSVQIQRGAVTLDSAHDDYQNEVLQGAARGIETAGPLEKPTARAKRKKIDRPFVVYKHRLDGRVLYVGCGKDPRHKNLAKSAHGPMWGEVVWPVRATITIQIIRRFADLGPAALFEAALIRRLKPPGNLVFNPSRNTRRFRLERREAATEYAMKLGLLRRAND